jgi:hypothetical protein
VINNSTDPHFVDNTTWESSGTIVWHHFTFTTVVGILITVSGICLLFLDSGVLQTKKATTIVH